MIQKTIADYFGMRVQDLKSKNNSKSVAVPRQICMYLCKKVTGLVAAPDRTGVWQ